MLFNSYTFIFMFLPVLLIGYQLAERVWGNVATRMWLAGGSLFFYGWWNPKYLSLVLVSIGFNYLLGQVMLKLNGQRRWLVLGIAGNLALLGYFKYAQFFVDNLNRLTGWEATFHSVVLPIGISFFTFTQIAYLADLRKGRTRDRGALDYLLFVTFFPHLIAGPIVHHRELVSQFDGMKRLLASNLTVGIGLFSLGLFKKVVVADSLAPYANGVFDAPDVAGLSQAEAWAGALAYTFQLYFDFSGFADMAVGLSRMFGIAMPCNFDSPYKSSSIIEFWQRWHMTLSRFVRDYLYIPLGGSRCGWFRRHANLLAVMLLMGLWHGAGWTFVVWGGIHGCLLLINHVWQDWAHVGLIEQFRKSRVWRQSSMALTFLVVVSAWVVFRAEGVQEAWQILRLMYGLDVGGVGGALPALDWNLWMGLALLLLVVWVLPNSQQIVGVNEAGELEGRPVRDWIFAAQGAGLTAALAFAAVALMQRPSPFLYFQF